MLLTGCVSLDQRSYPTDWPPISLSSEACPDLSGIYDNGDLGAHPIWLAAWVLPSTTYPLKNIDRVHVTGPTNGTVRFRLLKALDTVVAVREWHQGVDFQCDHGWLVPHSIDLAFAIPAWTGSVQARFARTVDGQFVAEVTEGGGGVALVVPMLSMYRHWHLYPVAVNSGSIAP